MGNRLEGRSAVGHLLRRTGFGPAPGEAERFGDASFEQVAETVAHSLAAPPDREPSGFDPYEPGAIQQLWLERMLAGASSAAERLALFWHGHFATSIAKVEDGELLWTQYRLFRERGAGSFRELLLLVSRDVAMIRWLDGNTNRAGHPNENYARELQELFTIGRGRFTEDDVREIARAFTGWGSRHHEFVYDDRRHDHGAKSIHGRTGDLGGEEVVEILAGLPDCHRFLAGKFLRAWSHPDPTGEEVEALASTFRETGGDVRTTLRALFLSPGFLDRARHRALVRSPTEFAIAALRATGFSTVPPWVQASLDRMGQILFRPPSVKGWTIGTGWLSSAAIVERLKFARRVAEEAPLAATDWILDVALDGEVPDRLARALEGVRGRDRIATVLGSPEFQLA